MWTISRRGLMQAAVAAAATGLTARAQETLVRTPTTRPVRQDPGVQVLNPCGRVPLSFFIDDSTCLVNMGHFCLPQFAQAWPDQAIYRKPWKTWPREIPDAFVREFGTFCAEHGVKGKYSIVPYPACVGWLDRELPGWSRAELRDSLKLVRELMLPNWDIHPEMITHTRVIDLRTGRPMEQISAGTMENSYPQKPISVDELAAYLAYALRILKNCELPCEGITTPGGFGNRVKNELPLATRQAVADVFPTDVPHYFKYVVGGNENPAPRLEYLEDANTDSPRFTVSVPAGTGDWFGGWDGDREPEGHRYASADATAGRMVELIERGGPAIMLCHWPGLYSHGTMKGLAQFKQVATALEGRYRDRTLWMKIGEIARYWAARELTRIERDGARITFTSPIASPRFTVKIAQRPTAPPRLMRDNQAIPLREVSSVSQLQSGTYHTGDGLTVCFDLAKGSTVLSAL